MKVAKYLSSLTLGAVVGISLLPVATHAAAPGQREGNFEFFLPLVYSPSDTIDGKSGTEVDLNSDVSVAFGFAYNFTDKFQLGGSFNISNRGYDATLVDANGSEFQVSGSLDSSTIAMNATYYFMDTSNITPFVSGGIGATFVDTNIQNGQSQTACWWDPWWGYICDSYTPTKDETGATFLAGIGVRWDISRSFALQGSYNRQWIELDESTPDLAGWKIDFILGM